jgi:tRNA pseudouridine55 synthase
MNGWIILDKAAGASSRFAGSKIARLFGAKKFGHLGTLDPFATGVLPIALGHATKMIPFLEERAPVPQKEYFFRIKWGMQTDTDDLTGAIVAENNQRPTIEQIQAALPQLTGKIDQTPPAYSAIHVDGMRAYQLARRGKAVDLPKRPVLIERLEIIENTGGLDDILYHAACSTGTYVRSISREIGRLISTDLLCTTSVLRRTRNYGFDIKNTVTLDFCENLYHNTPDLLQEYLRPIDFGLDDILVAELDGDQAILFQNGGRIVAKDNNVGYARVYASSPKSEISSGCGDGFRFLGIAESKDGVLHPKRIIKD